MNYYLITGLENGEPITPFIVESETIPHDIYLQTRGDKSRWYTPISKKKCMQLLKQGIELV